MHSGEPKSPALPLNGVDCSGNMSPWVIPSEQRQLGNHDLSVHMVLASVLQSQRRWAKVDSPFDILILKYNVYCSVEHDYRI